jgi:hypothetical protein
VSDLINTLEASGEFDALAKLRPGEPYFVLIGRDTLAPQLLKDWADRNRRRAIADFEADPPRINSENYKRECRKSTQAEMIAAEMLAFKRGHASDVTPNPVLGDTNTSWVGAEVPEETKRADALQAARSRSASAINNAVAEVSDLLELLDSSRSDEEALMDTAAFHLIDNMKAASYAIKPPRFGIKAA